MEVQPDFRDLLELFNKHRVEFLLVGGYALAFHGAPRYTGDMDILVHASSLNATRIMAALAEFGFGSVGLTVEDFQQENRIIQLGVPPVRVDIVTSLTGISWEEAYTNRVNGKYGEVLVSYIGRNSSLPIRRQLADIRTSLTWKRLEKNSHSIGKRTSQSLCQGNQSTVILFKLFWQAAVTSLNGVTG